MPSRSRRDAPRRVLTDWTTSAGVDGTGLLALVLGGATAEGIHLATLGYEVFVLHADDASAEAAEPAGHVHHVVAEPAGLPEPWHRRFDLVVALDVPPTPDQVGPAGLLVAVSGAPVPAADGLDEVVRERVEDPDRPGVELHRTVLARLA